MLHGKSGKRFAVGRGLFVCLEVRNVVEGRIEARGNSRKYNIKNL